MWQTLIDVSKSKNSPPRFHAPSPRTPPMKHARGSTKILNIARHAGPWWMLTHQTLPKLSFWRNLAYHTMSPNVNVSSNFRIVMSMGPTWNWFKLFTRNYSEADTCTIWNYNMKSQTGQKENANDWQTFEQRPKTWKKCPQKIGPRFDKFGPDHHRTILLYKPGLKKPSLQAILN